MAWERKRHKNGKIYVETDADGAMLVSNGLVTGKYRPDDPRTYSFKADKVRNLDGAVPGVASRQADNLSATHPRSDAGTKEASSIEALPPASRDFVEIHTDGATSGNPGPSGLGVVLRWGDHCREIHQYIGEATNNIAELMAIKVGLEAVKDPRRMPVKVYTDSQYALGVLTGQYKARTNLTLITETQTLMAGFADLEIIKVKGHAGNPLNERADALARRGVQAGSTQSSDAGDKDGA